MHIATPAGEKIIDYIRGKLNTDYKRKLKQLSDDLKTVNHSTICRIASGDVDPKLSTTQALLDYFKANETKQKPRAKKVRG